MQALGEGREPGGGSLGAAASVNSSFQGLADRLNVRVSMPETGSRRVATENLDGALTAGRPAVAWVDRASLPYLQLPERLRGRLGHIVAVCGRASDGYLVDDRAATPFFVPAATFGDARERIPSYKQRLLLVDARAPFDLVAAVQSGIAAQVDYLSSGSDSFALPALRKWARLLTHPTRRDIRWSSASGAACSACCARPTRESRSTSARGPARAVRELPT